MARVEGLEFLKQFNRQVALERVPISGSVELTRRCNLDCVHCYLGPRRLRGRNSREMTTQQVVAIVDQITDAGCLYLLLTGGEPLLRPDFEEIYRHAKRKGLLVTLFTNGTLVDDRLTSLFVDLPPHLVEISLYGATMATYQRISRLSGSHRRCVAGIERLLAAGVRVGLKTMVMTHNQQELAAIETMARGCHAPFRLDAAIFPCLDGGRAPLTLRVDPRDAVAMELADADRRHRWRDYRDRVGNAPASDDLYQCGAALTGFHVDASGRLQPCVMVSEPGYSLLNGSFEQGWCEVLPRLRAAKVGADNACRACDKRALCGHCPGFFRLENGRDEEPSPYLCALGSRRLQQLSESEGPGKNAAAN